MLLPSGRVRFSGMSDCAIAAGGVQQLTSRLTGETTTVRVDQDRPRPEEPDLKPALARLFTNIEPAISKLDKLTAQAPVGGR